MALEESKEPACPSLDPTDENGATQPAQEEERGFNTLVSQQSGHGQS